MPRFTVQSSALTVHQTSTLLTQPAPDYIRRVRTGAGCSETGSWRPDAAGLGVESCMHAMYAATDMLAVQTDPLKLTKIVPGSTCTKVSKLAISYYSQHPRKLWELEKVVNLTNMDMDLAWIA